MALNIVLNSEKSEFFKSRVGGIPYWNPSTNDTMPYPEDEEGRKMVLLCQVNLEEAALAEKHGPLPKKGMLQFFVTPEDQFYGMCFEDMFAQKNFRVVYHSEIDESVTEEQVVALGAVAAEAGKTPIKEACGMDFEKVLFAGQTKGKSNILGVPEFTQEDPRSNLSVEDEKYLDTCLLKLESGSEICWGDRGIGVFLMNGEALKKGDFSRVLYSWDCY